MCWGEAMDITHSATGERPTLGLVKKIHVQNEVLPDHYSEYHSGEVVKVIQCRPAAHMGDVTCMSYGPLYRVPRLVWAS
ncbi:uncharacterized protein PHACADRAFT_246391 [Phanerochaete carnosa HHB-10118-sp]|uniref:Uncharacterized protein n=1 Tax=Phanerochaete carnosa (strain HHB-10118-sp) TaxID=650164 RepID=K5WLZ2_PHACS|nr:uncharacterized protein PHACADRAFT_246391 [Phanerochaete carnosa HHB-10118-sp]EKM60445.1 hypothetical protein PHACADRAFT_246391 [Phanerochaete carnosa HHB-10118-sp]